MLNKPLFKQVAWAFYLACSWTWCIGMFLPVILQKDFGNGAWLFFIIANVVGATAFSFFINSYDKSQRFVEQHKTACVLFSVITIIFQLFFVGWVLSYLSNMDVVWVLLMLIAVSRIMKRTDLSVVAIILWFLSLAVFANYLIEQPPVEMADKLAHQFMNINPQALYALPLLALGFLLCPYLDLTFHHVVQAARTPEARGNRISFLIGFPLLFATLMVFSLLYADTAKQVLLNPRDSFVGHSMLIKNLFLYFILQAYFTSMAHWQVLQKHMTQQQALGLGGGAMIMVALGFFASIEMNEITYRLFMSVYGIIAPAYLWIVAFNKKITSKNIFLIGTALSLMLSAIPLFSQSNQTYYCYPLAVGVVIVTRFFSVKS